jgi:hypothetical protein
MITRIVDRLKRKLSSPQDQEETESDIDEKKDASGSTPTPTPTPPPPSPPIKRRRTNRVSTRIEDIPPLPTSSNEIVITEDEVIEIPKPLRLSKPLKVYDMFKQGDVVFGLIRERNKVAVVLEKSGHINVVANDLNTPKVEEVIRQQKTSLSNDPHVRYHHQLLDIHTQYLSKPGGKPIPTCDASGAISAALRRGCKLLLVNRDPGRISNAHFITNGIDWRRLCYKYDAVAQKPCHATTGSEIRAVYRDEKQNGRNPHIFFYDKNLIVMKKRPWDTMAFGKYFHDYQQSRTKKSKP